MHSLLFSGHGSCQAHRPPPATNPAPPRPLRWGELGTLTAGSAQQLRCRPCHTGAGPWPVTAHWPLHLPPSPTALGDIRFSSNTQQLVCRYIAELPSSASFLQPRLCACSVAAQAVQKHKPDLDTIPPHSVSDHDVPKGLLFCLSQCRGLPCARPRCPGRGTRLLGSTAA